MVKAEERAIKDDLTKGINKLQLHSSELATSMVSVCDMAYIGYIYRCNEPDKQLNFSHSLQNVLEKGRL